MPSRILPRSANFQVLATLFAVLATPPGSVVAQQNNANQQVSTGAHPQSSEVVLPVTVRDKHGNLVTNLQASDFTLSEEGRPQTIKSLTTRSDLPLQVGLVVETGRSVSGAMEEERKAAGKFIDRVLSGDAQAASTTQASASATQGTGKDQAFLLHFDREVELLQDFTASREKLHHEIDDMGPTSRSEDSQGPETTGDDRERPRGGTRNGTQLYDAIFLASDELMKPKQGRKALIVFSNGVDRGSKETMNEALDAADHANLTIYAIYVKGEQDRSGVEYPGGRRGGIGFPGGGGGGYPGGGGGYPGGGRRGAGEPGMDGRKIMSQIAERTGGRYFDTKKTADLPEIYGYIAEELHGQYVLTYTPDKPDNDGGFHKIELKARNGDLTVLTRAGYYAPGGDAK